MARVKKILPPNLRSHQLKDHAGRTYTVVGDKSRGPSVKLGFQLYCLGSPTPSPEDLGDELLREPLPHIVPTWCSSEKYWEGCLSWEDVIEKGLLQVGLDLDVTPTMEALMDDLPVEDDSLLEGEKHGWMDVERTYLELKEPVERVLLRARRQLKLAILVESRRRNATFFIHPSPMDT
ncbi:hypothetical protein B0T10DRAFT_569677 [Thelonectria olida]|uniref:Uncharacterized protein n=1 Tax=Thelonectria olida TaxID=1576542 RepID=A0A9P8VNK4_9HYPO|nr:hypothetical protein B0T10DRAFT_569677 [Thelonectria olida]